LEAAQIGETFAAFVQRQELALLQSLGLQLGDDVGPQRSVPGQRQGERRLRLVACEASGRIQNAGELVLVGQVIGLVGSQVSGDLLQLFAPRQFVVHDDEEFL
jgi:hypothetical protein